MDRQQTRALSSLLIGVAFLLGGIMFYSEPLQAQPADQAVILQYHFISTATPPVTSTSPEDFRRHMDYLQDNNFVILPLEEIISKLRNAEALPDYTAAITFDDGYLSVYTEAFPLLLQRDWPFTVFVTTGLLESNSNLYANWDQIREMAAAGATIANHTVSHPYFLKRLDAESERAWLERIRGEIQQAEDAIVEETGQNHRLLAYPYGEFNPQIQELVADMGFIGIAQHSGPINAASDYTALPRFPFSGIYVSMNTFPNKVKSLAFTLDGISPQTPITSNNSPDVEIDFAEGTPGLSQLACYHNNQRMQLETLNANELLYWLGSSTESNGRRFRYNCTAPGRDGRYYWYSIPWINPAIAE